MFILDSLMISGIRWALETALTAAEAEMNDDSVLREQLLEAEMRREMGEISDAEFQEMEADLLARIREIKERREGGSGPIEFGAEPIEASEDSTFKVEASISGDFHDPAATPHTTVVETDPVHGALGNLVQSHGGEKIAVLDMDTPGPLRKRTATSARAGTARPARTAKQASRAKQARTAKRVGTAQQAGTAKRARRRQTP